MLALEAKTDARRLSSSLFAGSPAAIAWKAFLVRYPPDGETEDAAQKRYSDAARLELMRVYYLGGKAAEGDALLEAADPLGLR